MTTSIRFPQAVTWFYKDRNGDRLPTYNHVISGAPLHRRLGLAEQLSDLRNMERPEYLEGLGFALPAKPMNLSERLFGILFRVFMIKSRETPGRALTPKHTPSLHLRVIPSSPSKDTLLS